ncbi:uracil-DNA glycosylase-like protein [Geopyxis carbonaria]|nr:uracil-DNA glycosylase-like protein [Geopyxis carbonaria]
MSVSSKRKAADTLIPGSAKKPSTITNFFTSAPTTTKSSVLKFNKEEWVASLTTEQKDLLKLEIETLHESWLGALKDEILKPSFLSLKSFLKKETGTVFPPREDIYTWSRHCPLETVKVVILGQDPYHGPKQAMGMSFSVRKPVPAPPSLVNIYKGIKHDYPSFCPPPNRGGDLTPWAKRGVLMLNACLTVKQGQPNSHKDKGWEQFTSKVIEVVNQQRSGGVAFLAWGAQAALRISKVDQKKHLVLKSAHPSPYSANKGFLDNGHFLKTNNWLQEKYGDKGPIDWSLHGSPVGIVAINQIAQPLQEQHPITKTTETKRASLTAAECTFDADEEEAMLDAVIHAEKKHCSELNKDSEGLRKKEAGKIEDSPPKV